VEAGDKIMRSRFQPFSASVMGNLPDAEAGKLPRGVLAVGLVFFVGALVAIGAACLALL
jgi:hypothetical protein